MERTAGAAGWVPVQTTPDVRATVTVTIATRAPDVVLAFDGLDAPTALFAELHSIGWTVPPVPPPPRAAIEWTPDPTTGQDYTLKPWRVKEFRLRPSPWWTDETEREIGPATLDALRRHGASIAGRPAEQPGGATDTELTATNTAPSGPVPATLTQTIIVLEAGSGGVVEFISRDASRGRQREPWVWSEGAQLAPGALDELVAVGAHVWILDPDDRPVPDGAHAVVNLIAIDTAPDDRRFPKLQKLLGSQLRLHHLRAGADGPDAVLATALVPANTATMLTANLRLRFPKMIIRDD